MKAKNVSAKRLLLLLTTAGAVAVMGALTLSSNPGDSHRTGGGVAVIADTETQSTPPPKPAIPSAAPTMKSSPWKGGDWPGT
ncbi:MAG TPA: hypothetical protein VH496_20145 [Mycobacterium sp.]